MFDKNSETIKYHLLFHGSWSIHFIILLVLLYNYFNSNNNLMLRIKCIISNQRLFSSGEIQCSCFSHAKDHPPLLHWLSCFHDKLTKRLFALKQLQAVCLDK